jgi:hypothetical protein
MYLQIDGLAFISMVVKEINALVVDAVSSNDSAINIDWKAYIGGDYVD